MNTSTILTENNKRKNDASYNQKHGSIGISEVTLNSQHNSNLKSIPSGNQENTMSQQLIKSLNPG